MDGIIKVNPEVLINTAGEFSSEGTQIGGLTTQMMELINGLPNTWIGEAANAYVTKFNGLQDDIERLLRMVQEHSEDLETMAQTYINAEVGAGDVSQTLSDNVLV